MMNAIGILSNRGEHTQGTTRSRAACITEIGRPGKRGSSAERGVSHPVLEEQDKHKGHQPNNDHKDESIDH